MTFKHTDEELAREYATFDFVPTGGASNVLSFLHEKAREGWEYVEGLPCPFYTYTGGGRRGESVPILFRKQPLPEESGPADPKDWREAYRLLAKELRRYARRGPCSRDVAYGYRYVAEQLENLCDEEPSDRGATFDRWRGES